MRVRYNFSQKSGGTNDAPGFDQYKRHARPGLGTSYCIS